MSGKYILAFEADPMYANMLHETLAHRGYQVDIVSDGVEGLDKAGEKTPDLIYLCVELPRISGFSICNKLKKNQTLKDVPLLITSEEATVETFEKHKRLKGHADEYMHKPFSAEEIAAVVDSLLDGSNRSDEETEEGGDDIEGMVLDDEDAVVLESDDDLENLGDLEDVAGGDGTEASGETKSVDSDINALADRAFDGLEMKSEEPMDESYAGRPSVSGPEVVQMVEEEAEAREVGTESLIPDPLHPSAKDLNRLKSKNDDLLRKIDNLEKQLIAAKSPKRSSISSSEFLDLREALNNKDRELLDMKDTINGKEKEILNLRDKLNGLERKKADLEDKNIEIQKQLNQMERQLEDLGVEREHLSQKSAEQEQQINAMEETVALLEEHLDAEKSGREADIQREKENAAKMLEEQRARMETEANARREADLAGKQAAHNAATEALHTSLTAEKEQALAALRNDHAAEIESVNRAHTERENALSGRIVTEQDNVAKLKEEKAAVEGDLNSTLQSLDNTMKQLEITQQTLKETGESLETEQKEHANTRSRLSEIEHKLEDQIARGDDLDKTVENLDSKISDLNGEVDELTELIQRNDEVSDKAKKAIAIAAQLLEDLETVSADEEVSEDE